MKLTMWKSAAFASLVGLGTLAMTANANAQSFQFRYDSNRYNSYNDRRQCDRYQCWTVRCDRFGRSCYRTNYSRSTYRPTYRPGRYYVCDPYRRCAWTPYPRAYYQRYPSYGFSFGFRF